VLICCGGGKHPPVLLWTNYGILKPFPLLIYLLFLFLALYQSLGYTRHARSSAPTSFFGLPRFPPVYCRPCFMALVFCSACGSCPRVELLDLLQGFNAVF
jgi:hypothetical protein